MSHDFKIAVALLVLSGCGQIHRYDTSGWADEVVDTGSESGNGQGDQGKAFEVDSVWPAFGSDAGGSTVRILGGPFDDVDVFIDGEPATVVEALDGEIVVETPPGLAGLTQLEVVSGDTRRSHPFRYWPDAQGMIGLKGFIEYVDVVGDYWTDGGFDRARVEIALIEPVDFESWEAFTPTFNSCASDWSLPSDTPVDGMDEVVLVSSNVRVDLEDDGDGFSSDGGVTPGSSYTLEPSGEWEGIVLDDLVEVPMGLQIQAPVLDGLTPRKVQRQFDITWDRTIQADYVAIVLERAHFESNGSVTIDQKVSCAVPDVGSFTVAGSVWNDWQSGDLITVSVGRVVEGPELELPHNNASTAVSGAYWVSGIVRAQ